MTERAAPNGQDFQVGDPQPVPQESKEQPMVFEKNRGISFDMRGIERNFAGAQAHLVWLMLGENTIIPVGVTDAQLEAYRYSEGQAAVEIFGETDNNIKRLESTKSNVNSKLSVPTVGLRIDARFVPSPNDPNKKERELFLHALSPGQSPAENATVSQSKGADKPPTNGSEKPEKKDVTSAFDGQRPMSLYDLSTSDFIEQVRQSVTSQGAPLSKLEELIAEQGITTHLTKLNAVRKWTRILQQADIVVFDDGKEEDVDENSEHTEK